jgi:hypothetical protein
MFMDLKDSKVGPWDHIKDMLPTPDMVFVQILEEKG